MRNKISGIINIIISAFILIAISTFLHPCAGKMQMACGYSTKSSYFILVLLIVLGIGKFIVSDFKGTLWLNVTSIVAGVELLFIPKIGKCGMASMACNSHTFPALTVAALLIIAVTIIFAVVDILDNREKKHGDSQ